MKKIGLLLLALTGCACGNKHEALYRQALKDTNASLTQCRDDDEAAHRTIRRLEAQLAAYKRSRHSK